MHQSTEYLLTQLHLNKLSRLRCGKDYPNQKWAEFDLLLEAATERFGARFQTQEKDKHFRLHALITFYIPFWESTENPEY